MNSRSLLLTAMLAGLAWPTYAAEPITPAPTNWNNHCSDCHGRDGRGKTKEGRRLKLTDLTNRLVQASFTDEQAFNIIKRGLRDDEGPVMHPASSKLTDDEIRALVKHVRSLKR